MRFSFEGAPLKHRKIIGDRFQAHFPLHRSDHELHQGAGQLERKNTNNDKNEPDKMTRFSGCENKQQAEGTNSLQ